MKMNLLKNIEEVLLMGPGPSCIHPKTYDALRCKTLGHLDSYFLKIMDEIQLQLQTVMNTKNNLTLPISGTGSAGMEACFVNLVEPQDSVLVLINGVFGKRMVEVATRLGAKVDSIEFEWCLPIDLGQVKEKLEKNSYDILAIVHAETSTGVQNPIGEISNLLKGSNTLFLVDAAFELAKELSEMPANAVSEKLRCIIGYGDRPLQEGLYQERQAVLKTTGTKENREGMMAFFQKRKPNFIDL
jgi:alanine-glyoxylate transaminase/serine-glyoxylate transaminase/serine-pyruvate transaminase